MKSDLTDLLRKVAARLPLVGDFVDVMLYRAIARQNLTAFEKWLSWRDHSILRPSLVEFQSDLIARAVFSLNDNQTPTIKRIIGALIDRNILPSEKARELLLTILADKHEFDLLFAMARKTGITRREGTLCFLMFQAALETAIGDEAGQRWLDEFKPDPLVEHMPQYMEKLGPGDLRVMSHSIAKNAFKSGSNELLLKMLDLCDHIPPAAAQGLIGRTQPLSVEVVARMERLNMRWGDVLENEFPDSPPWDRLAYLNDAVELDLVTLISQAQKINAADDQVDALNETTPPAGGRRMGVRRI